MNWQVLHCFCIVCADVKDSEVYLILPVEVQPSMDDAAGCKDLLEVEHLQGVGTCRPPMLLHGVCLLVENILADVHLAVVVQENGEQDGFFWHHCDHGVYILQCSGLSWQRSTAAHDIHVCRCRQKASLCSGGSQIGLQKDLHALHHDKSLFGARWHMQALCGIWPQISSFIQAQCVVAIACVGCVCFLAWHLRCDLSTFDFALVL